MTGTGALAASRVETEPKTADRTGPWPRVPTTMIADGWRRRPRPAAPPRCRSRCACRSDVDVDMRQRMRDGDRRAACVLDRLAERLPAGHQRCRVRKERVGAHLDCHEPAAQRVSEGPACSTAASAPADPSIPTTMVGSSPISMAAPGGTTMTGHGEAWAIAFETLPRRAARRRPAAPRTDDSQSCPIVQSLEHRSIGSLEFDDTFVGAVGGAERVQKCFASS